MSHDDELIKS